MARKQLFYPRWVFVLFAVLALFHQNPWLWADDRLVLGLPVNLLYHVVLSLFVSMAMVSLILCAWPKYLDKE